MSTESAQRGHCARCPRVFLMDLLCTVPYYTGHLCKALAPHPAEVTLGSITYHLDPQYFSREGIRNILCPCDVASRFSSRPALRRVLKLGEYLVNLTAMATRFLFRPPDVLHVQFLPLAKQGLPIEEWFLRFVKARGVTIVYTVHNVLPQDTGDHHRERYRRIYRLVDLLICHNQSAKLQLVEQFGIDADCIHTIPHGPLFHEMPRFTTAEARKRLEIRPGECVVLWQGFIRPYKGVPFLLEAWRKIQEHRPNARLYVVGSGESALLEQIRSQIRDLGIEASVEPVLRFVSVEEVSAYYQAADIVVYPYKEITTSGALMTGIIHHKPIVATALPAFEELFGARSGEVLVNYGDVGGLASALGRLIADPVERTRLGNEMAALQPLWSEIAERTMDCYRTALAMRSTAKERRLSNSDATNK